MSIDLDRWRRLAAEAVRDEDVPRHVAPVLRAVFEADWPEHERTWPRSAWPPDPHDPLGPDPEFYVRAINRLYPSLAAHVRQLLDLAPLGHR